MIVVAREWPKTQKWAKCSFLGDGVGQVGRRHLGGLDFCRLEVDIAEIWCLRSISVVLEVVDAL